VIPDSQVGVKKQAEERNRAGAGSTISAFDEPVNPKLLERITNRADEASCREDGFAFSGLRSL
jgi:hypothetical protein